jgi:hypothetical protein
VANSVSKINIVVGASTGQLTQGMNQAAASVKGGMSKVQQVSQAATFAVDDFFAAFATGGVAGGLRGAGNNLTQIASMLGGIKTQLTVIAVLAAGQFLAKYFSKGKSDAKELNDELERMSGHFKTMRSLGEIRRGIVAQQGEAAAFRDQRGAPTRDQFSAERERIEAARKSSADRAVNAQREAMELFNETTKQERRARAMGEGKIDPASAERFRGQRADVRRLQSEAQMNANAVRDLDRQRKLLDEREKELEPSRFRQKQAELDALYGGKFQAAFVTQDMRNATKRELEDVTDELNSRRGRLSMADMFSRMPSAHAMGSSGAVGAINSAMMGPQNAQNAGLSLQRQSAADLRRIRELEEKKKGLLEVVGL